MLPNSAWANLADEPMETTERPARPTQLAWVTNISSKPPIATLLGDNGFKAELPLSDQDPKFRNLRVGSIVSFLTTLKYGAECMPLKSIVLQDQFSPDMITVDQRPRLVARVLKKDGSSLTAEVEGHRSLVFDETLLVPDALLVDRGAALSFVPSFPDRKMEMSDVKVIQGNLSLPSDTHNQHQGPCHDNRFDVSLQLLDFLADNIIVM